MTTPEASATILARALALAACNPCAALVVDLTLARDAPARLDVFDATGRRVAARDLAGLSAGPHRLELGAARVLRPGVYALRLSQGGEGAQARAVIVP